MHLSWALMHSVGIALPPAPVTFMSSPNQDVSKLVNFLPCALTRMAQRLFMKHTEAQQVVMILVFLRFLVCYALMGAKNPLKTYNQMLFNILKSNTIQNGYFTQHYINNMNTILPYGGTFKYRLTKIPVLFFPLNYYTKHDK